MKNLLLISIFSLLLSSCATIKQGKYQNVQFDSSPAGADVWVNDQLVGQTPTMALLERSNSHIVCIDLPGYHPYTANLYPTVSGWVFGNLVFGGVVGVAVDAYTGSMYKLTPNQLYACLQEESDVIISKSQETDDCQLLVVSEADPSWEKVGNLEPSSS